MLKIRLANWLPKLKYPALLLALTVFAYGLYFSWFGFYGDDWSYVWYQHLLGYGGPGAFASVDRPLSSLFYNPVMAIFGEGALPYHILNLLLRWLSGCLFFTIIQLMAPGQTGLAAWAGILLVLYPGFTSQPIAVEFILHFFVFDLCLLSIWLMLISLGKRGAIFWVMTLLSMLSAASLFLSEYFIGLELARPVVLFHAICNTESKLLNKIIRTLKAWVPTLIVALVFVYWRVFVFKFPTYQPHMVADFTANPVNTLKELAVRILIDIKVVLIDAWRQVLILPEGKRELLYIVLMVSSAVVLIYLFWHRIVKPTESPANDQRQFWKDKSIYPILFGFFLTSVAGWPFWITHIPVRIDFPWDRSILPFLPGLSLIIAGLLELLFRKPYHVAVLGVMVGLSLFFHYQNAKEYRYEWEKMRQFFWQLSWRAPALEPGTVLVSDDIPLYRHSDNNLNAPLQWTYAPDLESSKLPYKFFDLYIRMDPQYNDIPELVEGIPIVHNYKTTTFSSSTSAILAYYQDPDKCVRVVSADDSSLRFLPEKVALAAKISKLNRIISNSEAQAVPPDVFLPEPEHGWCYLFQKADLALQNSDYRSAVDLYNQAVESGFTPRDATELLPFIKAFTALGQLGDANNLIDDVLSEPKNQAVLCDHLHALKTSQDMQEKGNSVIQVLDYAGCQP